VLPRSSRTPVQPMQPMQHPCAAICHQTEQVFLGIYLTSRCPDGNSQTDVHGDSQVRAEGDSQVRAQGDLHVGADRDSQTCAVVDSQVDVDGDILHQGCPQDGQRQCQRDHCNSRRGSSTVVAQHSTAQHFTYAPLSAGLENYSQEQAKEAHM